MVRHLLIWKCIFFVLIIVGFDLVGDTMAEQFAHNGKIGSAVISIGVFAIAGIAMVCALRSGVSLASDANIME